MVEAIEDATADGVDVINFSVGGSQELTNDPVPGAFLFAADAGVFVAAAAGNNGPAATVDNVEPWVTTVGAGTHDRGMAKTVTLGNGAQYTGAGRSAASPILPLIRAQDAGFDGVDPDAAAVCPSRNVDPSSPEGFLDPAKVAGKIVICERGLNNRFDKAVAVTSAGGGGMILANVEGGQNDIDELSFDSSFPIVHVTAADGSAIEAYAAASPDPTASLSESIETTGQEAPSVARFSSRGPASGIGGNVLKPDILAPRRARLRADGLRICGVQRHVDGSPARRRARGPAHSEPPEVESDGRQVGAAHHRGRPGQQGTARSRPRTTVLLLELFFVCDAGRALRLRLGRGDAHRGQRSRPCLRQQPRGLAAVGVWHAPARAWTARSAGATGPPIPAT